MRSLLFRGCELYDYLSWAIHAHAHGRTTVTSFALVYETACEGPGSDSYSDFWTCLSFCFDYDSCFDSCFDFDGCHATPVHDHQSTGETATLNYDEDLQRLNDCLDVLAFQETQPV